MEIVKSESQRDKFTHVEASIELLYGFLEHSIRQNIVSSMKNESNILQSCVNIVEIMEQVLLQMVVVLKANVFEHVK